MALTPEENAANLASYTNGYNGVALAVDNHSLASGGADLEHGIMQHASYGIATAFTSGALGVYNSLKAVVNMAGAELPMTDTKEVVHDVFGEDAAKYYAQNKLGVDATGMVASTLAVGVGAIGGMRAAQARGILSMGFQNATGLRNADIVLGSAQALTARQAVLSNATAYGWNTRQTWAAVGWAARQNVQESLVAEAAWNLTHNQNEIINPQHLSAWDSMKQTASEGLPFLVGGTIVGTISDAARITGSLRAAYDAAEAVPQTAALKLIVSDLQTAALPGGDQLTQILRGRDAVRALADTPAYLAPEFVQFHVQRVEAATKQLNALEQDAIIRLNRVEGEYGKTSPLELVQQATASGKAEEAVTLLGNATGVRLATVAEQQVQREFFTQSAAPTILTDTAAARVAAVVATAVANAAKLDPLDSMTVLRELNVNRVRGNNHLFEFLGNALKSSNRKNASSDNVLAELAQYAKETGRPEWRKLLNDMNRELRNPTTSVFENLQAARKVEATGLRIGNTLIPPQFAERFANVMVDVATELQHSATGLQATSRMPNMAQLFRNVQAGALEPFNATKAFYNLRTGTVRQSSMLLAHDLGDVTEQAGQIAIGGTKLAYTYKQDYFTPRALLERIAGFGLEHSDDPFLEASAHWAAAAKRSMPAKFGNAYLVTASDLPMLEKVASDMKDTETALVRGGADGDKVFGKEALSQYVDAVKMQLRSELQLAGMNESHIGALLNTDEAFALGAKNSDSMLIGKRDFTKPESVVVQYRPYSPRDVDIRARSMVGLSARIEQQAALSATAAGKVLGPKVYELFPDAPPELLKALQLTEQRSGLVTSAQSNFGGAREFFAYVGRLVHQTIDTHRQKIETEMHGFYATLSLREKLPERMQLALFENLARTHDFNIVQLPDSVGNLSTYAVRTDAVEEITQRLAKQYGNSQAMTREQVLTGQVDSLLADRRAMKLLPDVADIVHYKMRTNTDFIANDTAVAQALGRTPLHRNADVYYPTPVNLRRTPHVAFVKPKEAQARDVGASSYMLYAESAETLQQKIRIAEEKYGARYDVVTQSDVSRYKKMKGEYEEGRVFNEWDFDTELKRMGKAGNLLPSVDIDAVESLDLIRNWMHRRGEQQIRSAVELRYADVVQGLKYADTVADSAASSLGGVRKEAYTMYKDSLRTMMDSQSYSGWAEGMYRSVNGFVGETGSRALDAATNVIRSIWTTHGFDQAKLDEVTATLDKLGVEVPYKKAFDALVASEVVTDGRSLSALSRLLNTVVAGSTLRLDFMNSFLQIVSTPILGLGVIREAKMALRGTPAGKRLLEMTTVANPVNGMREPSATKMLAVSIKNVFSKNPATVEMAEELRKRGILTDYTRQYMEAHDFSALNGRHTLQAVQQKVDTLLEHGSKITAHMYAEDTSRLWIADSIRQVCELRGMGKEETYRAIATAVDKVHGIYRAHSRVQLFNGVIGQSIGLFQTYMFNFMQHMFRSIGDRGRREAAILLGMQSAVFGVRSLPGFNMLNSAIAETNRSNADIYSMAGTDSDPTGLGSYVLYGLGSNFILPSDLYTRGDMVLRQATVIPTDFSQIPAVSIIAKASGNIADTVAALAHASSVEEAKSAAAHGLAHNGLNRPLQGIGTMLLGDVTTNQSIPLIRNVNYTDYNPAEGINAVSMAVRILGAKPRDEAIALDAYYRRTAYQTAQQQELSDLGAQVRTLALRTGAIDSEAVASFMERYKDRGGTLENFNGFMVRNLGLAHKQSVEKFAMDMQGGRTAASRSYNSWVLERGGTPNWSLDAMLVRDDADTGLGAAVQDAEGD